MEELKLEELRPRAAGPKPPTEHGIPMLLCLRGNVFYFEKIARPSLIITVRLL